MEKSANISQSKPAFQPQVLGQDYLEPISVFSHLPIAFYTCDADGYINFFNNAAAELWGRTPEIGKDLWCGSWKLYYPDGMFMPVEICPMAMCLHLGEAHAGVEIIIERPDLSIRNVLAYAKPIFDIDNNIIGAHNTLVDITKQKREEAMQLMLANIITSSDDAIISKNLNGVITSWNESATKMFGYKPEEVIGRSIKLLIPKNRYNEEDEILASISRGEQVRHYETDRLTKDGRIIKISLTISPIRNQEGMVIGASKIARDISEQVASRKKIKKYTKELENLNRQKDEFMSLASHELKTPLTSAKAYIQLLNKAIEANPREEDLIKRALQSISRLENLINDLLDVSKIKAGKLSYNMELIHFNEVIRASVSNVQLFSNTHTIVVKKTADVVMIGDKIRLEQVLNNLLTNAIKYSPNANKVEVESVKEGNNLVVSVKDYGIGIPNEYLEHVIERYYRVDNSTMRFPGLGVGLFISTEILKKHQAKMFIESEVNQGSTFNFIIPIRTEV
ncbi:PAS domain S-box protein [Albibacterium bauzanense]|uniref:histidine kinase n=1 Tax=Albibacterium bauzanense TaxID=653929 RepID=A0A4R1LVX1_9SPHI|nr:PAS domain S-box protein [Albibacterium bauzanense]TCK83586.1 PAS domain S-box-containing protein [Albibacterium bauzanense]